MRTRKPSSTTDTSAPASASLASATVRWSATPRSTTTSPWVITAPIAQVPATMRSGTVVYVTGASRSTPSTVMVDVPAPSIEAPIALSIEHRSTISGSRAALSTTVVPLASTAAMTRFSVAPTEGKSSQMLVPARRGAVATRNPCSLTMRAPSRSSPAMCMSSPREPMASPPGRATLAEPQRATSGPSTLIEARMRRTRS
jgi:hypothetical protein